jgi:hypothetical protein
MTANARATGYGLRATGYGLRATGYGLRAAEGRQWSSAPPLCRTWIRRPPRSRSVWVPKRRRTGISLTSNLMETKVPSMKETTCQSDPGAPGEAGELLAAANAAKKDIWSKTPKEWKVFLLWGIWVLVFVPPFDFFTGNAWWPVVWIASVVGGVATTAYFVSRSRRLHWTRQSSWRDWLVIFILYALIMASAAIVHSHFRYAWTTAALIAALPYFIAALVIRNRGRRHVAP